MVEDPYVLGGPRRRDKGPPRDRLLTLARFVVAGGTMFLLTSLGGAAIMAAPVLLPSLWWVSRSAGAWTRAGFAFLAALVATEVGWFLAYSALDERQPYIALGPAVGFVGTIVLFVLTRGRQRTDPAEVTGSASSR